MNSQPWYVGLVGRRGLVAQRGVELAVSGAQPAAGRWPRAASSRARATYPVCEFTQVTTAAAPARRRTPGPSPAARRRPASGGGCASVSASTCRTDADERLPTSASDAQVSVAAPRPAGRAPAAIASSTFGPPGWATQRVDVRGLEVVPPRKSSRSSPRLLPRPRRRRWREHDAEAAAADVPAHDPLGVRVEPAARARRTRGAGQAERAARRSPTITTAAAPSPNRPLATRLAIESSSRWMSGSTAPPRAARRRRPGRRADSRGPGRCRRRRPRSPARRSGTRLTSVRRPSRGTSRASRLGAAIPVTDVETMQVHVGGLAGRPWPGPRATAW